MEERIIFDPQQKTIEDIRKEHEVVSVVDTYREQLEDLFLIRNPQYRFNKHYEKELEQFIKDHALEKALEACGRWVYFPWSKTLAHYLEDAAHQEIRTARNRNLITKEEQDKFYQCKIGVAGLSVGSHGAVTLALMGGGREIRLADPDVISPTNLNRMRFDFLQVGMNKAEVIAQYIYQLNPYAEVRLFKEGITKDNAAEFVEGLDVLVEELDDIEMKVMMREEAKKRRIPVVMATDNGDNVIMDIERFDLNPSAPIFHGNLEGFDVEDLKESPKKMFEAMAKIIDVSLVPSRVLNSVSEVGKSIYSWPQLASAATLSGVVIAYVVRKIALGENVQEGKTEVTMDMTLDPDYVKNKELQKKDLERFFNSMRGG
jgi:hypothetical protein